MQNNKIFCFVFVISSPMTFYGTTSHAQPVNHSLEGKQKNLYAYNKQKQQQQDMIK